MCEHGVCHFLYFGVPSVLATDPQFSNIKAFWYCTRIPEFGQRVPDVHNVPYVPVNMNLVNYVINAYNAYNEYVNGSKYTIFYYIYFYYIYF